MNYSMVKSLIFKDWYFQRRAILLSLAGGVVSLGIVVFGGQAGFTIGLIFLVSILAIVSATTVMGNVLGEREHQTLAFVMSLPISYLEYTTSKIVGALLIFVPLWLAIVAGCLGLILAAPVIHGLFAFSVIMAVEILVSNCLLIAVALVTESKGWSTSAIVTGNVAISLVGYIVAHIPGISKGMWGTNGAWSTTIQWSPAASILLAIEFALIALFLGGAFFIQSRKKDFI
jgi:ABC-2 type transport system permease protein